MANGKKSASKQRVAGGGKGAQPSQTPPPDDSPPVVIPDDMNPVIWCAARGRADKLGRCFDDAEDPYHEDIAEKLIERDPDGKSALDYAALVGHTNVIKELVNRGFEVNTTFADTGYSAFHYAAAWGKLESLRTLVECGIDAEARTDIDESARDIAIRYENYDCAEYLQWAEVRQQFINAVKEFRDVLADPEKIQGKLDRNEKKQADGLCNEREQWLATSGANATTEDFLQNRILFEEAIEPHLEKIYAEPAETQTKKK